jgi:hypothetical protein
MEKYQYIQVHADTVLDLCATRGLVQVVTPH